MLFALLGVLRIWPFVVGREIEGGQWSEFVLSNVVCPMDEIVTQLQQTSLVEWLGTATGLIGVYLSVKERVLAWPFFVLCYLLYVFLSFSASFYAAVVLNACFIPISIYGWVKWAKAANAKCVDESLPITRMNGMGIALALGILILGTVLIGFALQRFVHGQLPFLDAFATTLSFMAQWLLSRKYIENWIAWLLADVAFIALWGWQGYWVAVGMFVVFTVLAVLGFLSWRKVLCGSVG